MNGVNERDSYLFGSASPQSEPHEPRLQSSGTKRKESNEKTSENSLNKANAKENKS